MEFNNVNNKKVLWATLMEMKAFEGLRDASQVQDLFENSIETIDRNDIPTSGVLEKNKKFLREFINVLNSLRQRGSMNNTPLDNNITRGDILQARNTEFDNKLKTMQNDFNSQITATAPQEIDFSDKNPDINNGNVNDMYMSIEERREKEIQSITNRYNKADDKTMNWLSLDANNQTNQTNQTNNIKIETEEISSENIISLEDKRNANNDKRVTFSINTLEGVETIENNIVKPAQLDITNIDTKLSEILSHISDINNKYERILLLLSNRTNETNETIEIKNN